MKETLKKRRLFRKGAIYMNEDLVLKDFSMQTLLNEFICDKRKRDVLHCWISMLGCNKVKLVKVCEHLFHSHVSFNRSIEPENYRKNASKIYSANIY